MKTVKLGELVKITIGRTPSRGNVDFWDKDKHTSNVWLSIADMLNADGRTISGSKEYITDEAAKTFAIVPQGTLLVSFKLTLGRLAYAGRDLRTNEAIAALHNDQTKVINDYLYHYLSRFDWNEYAKADQKVKGLTLNKAKLAEITVVYPESLEEQRKIVERLDAAFERISAAEVLMRRNLDNVVALQKSVLHKYLSASDSTHTHRLADLLKICHGKDWKSLASGAIPVYGSGGFMGKYVDTVAYDKPTVLLPRKGTITNIFYLEEPFWNVDTVFYTKIDTDKLMPRYFYYFMQTVDLQSLDSGSGRPSLTQSALYEITMPVPPVDKQISVAAQLDRSLDKTRKLKLQYTKKLTKLTDLRQSLLSEAFMTTNRVK